MKRFLTSLIVITSATGALAQTPSIPIPPPLQSVSVSGTGRSAVTPDRFSFNVGVQTMGDTVDDAVSQNNKRVAAVLAAAGDDLGQRDAGGARPASEAGPQRPHAA